MNTIYKIIAVVVWGLSVTACKKHLEEKSQDEVKPATVTELQEILMGEVYPIGSDDPNFQAYLDLMTDDMSSEWNPAKVAIGQYLKYEGPFTWSRDMYEKMQAAGTSDAIDTYAHYYRNIMGCNVVLDLIDKVRGEEADRENVRGQALAMRAYCYFMLVNLYGKPYNAAGVDINQTPGVELILSPVVRDEAPARASVAAVYQQIEEDLLKALPLIEQYGVQNSKYRVTPAFVPVLLSRMYLYKENWQKATEYATKGLSYNGSLFNLASQKWPSWNYYPTDNVYSPKSVEVIWYGSGGSMEYYYMVKNPWGPPCYCVSPDLRSKYEYTPGNSTNRGDLRARYFFYWEYTDPGYTQMQPMVGWRMTFTNTGNDASKGMRVSELYLNRAEGNIQRYLKNNDESLRQAALADLNTLRASRYDTRNVPYTPVDYSGQALLDFYRDERRRELVFEDHRWFDLRRYGMPEIRHTLKMYDGQAPVEYVLPKGGDRYVLPIPQSVLAKNPAMVPNP